MHRSHWSGGLVATILALAGAATVAAYAGQVAGSVEIIVGRGTCK